MQELPEQHLEPKKPAKPVPAVAVQDEQEETDDYDDDYTDSSLPRFKLPPPSAQDFTLSRTFEEACWARGFFDSDHEWSYANPEADQHGTSPAQLRGLFCLIVLNNEPADCLALWNDTSTN